jgi:hypothetical protein
MAIAVTCPACGRQYNVKDEAAGKKFKCKDCGEAVSVPEPGVAGGRADDFGDPYNPYADDDFGVERAPPVSARPPRSSSRGRTSAAGRTAGPGISLIVCGTLCLLVSIGIGILLLVVGATDPPPGAGPEFAMIMTIYGLSIMLIGGGINTVVILGGNSLRTGGSYGMALAGSIVAVIPCVSPCICWPFGIWALVVLNDPDVKASFR